MEANKKKERVAAGVLFVFALVYLFGCLPLSVGALNNPGSGLIPRVIGGLLLFFTSIHLYQTFGGKSPPAKAGEIPKEKEKNYLAVFGIAACVIVYPFLLRNLHFLLATFIVVFFMLWLLKYKTILTSLLISLGVTVASFLIFSRLLGVVLPSGILEQFLITLG